MKKILVGKKNRMNLFLLSMFILITSSTKAQFSVTTAPGSTGTHSQLPLVVGGDAAAFSVGHGGLYIGKGGSSSASSYNLAIGNVRTAPENGVNVTTTPLSLLGASQPNGTANFNIAIGHGALRSLTGTTAATAMGNTAVGQQDVLGHITTGANNTAIGVSSMNYFSGASSGNTAVGSGALRGVQAGTGTLADPYLWTSTGSNNCAFGAGSLSLVVAGNNNVGIGSGAQVFFNTSSVVADNSNQLSIQNVIYGSNMNSGASGRIRIGSAPARTTTGTIVAGAIAKLRIDGADFGNSSTSTIPSLQLDHVPIYSGALPVTNPTGTGKYLFIDQAGVVSQAPLPTAGGGVTAVCTSGGFIPMWSGGTLDCSIISQAQLANCATGTHFGIGIAGAPVATAISNSTCYNLMLTVNGSALANGGLWIASDKKFKANIQEVESAIDKISRMRGVYYNYDIAKFPEYNFSEAKTIGFIAQELKEVIPEAVSFTDKGFYAVNYDAIIPVLTKGIKEQQSWIEKLQLENESFRLQISDLRNRINQLAPGDVKINVNSFEVIPNPITGTSIVSYKVNNVGATSFLIIADLQGKLLKQISFPKNVKDGQIQINKSDLPNGLYIFSLLSDNTEIQSKKVLVAE